MSVHARMACNPILKKLEGDEKIQSITPVIDAQFLIGKSWDASLRLPWPEVYERHCTIEKVEANKWTVVSHENAIIHVNNEILTRGLPKLLQFGDLLRITSAISFHFKCSCMDCDDLNSVNGVPMAKRPRFTDINYSVAPRETNEYFPQPCFQVPSDENLRSRCEQLSQENVQLNTRLKSVQEIAVYWETEKNKTRACYFNAVESYNDVLEKYTQLRRIKEASDRDQEKLRNTISSQSATIDRLNLRLSQLQQDFYNVESFKHNLDSRNKQLTADNAVMRLKVEKYVEYVKSLHRKNIDLQTEVNNLKQKNEGNGNFIVPSLGESLNISAITSDASSDLRNSLTDLLETELKCSICDEVFIEAVVTNCTHIFCNYCIKSWKAIKPNCPICRSILNREAKVPVIDSFISNVMPLVTENLRSNWSKISEERKRLKNNAAIAQQAAAKPAVVEYSLASSSASENVDNFHDALMNVYRHLLNYENVIDLTI